MSVELNQLKKKTFNNLQTHTCWIYIILLTIAYKIKGLIITELVTRGPG